MTNIAFREVLVAGDDARRDLILITAERLGTAIQYVEKDFWVCWMLDALFNGLPTGHPRLLFNGGTSLSKWFGLINRFSEDIDITVFRHDLGQDASIEDLEALSGKKRRAKLDAIKAACQEFIAGPLRRDLSELAAGLMSAAGVAQDRSALSLTPMMPTGKRCSSGIPWSRPPPRSTSARQSKSRPAQSPLSIRTSRQAYGRTSLRIFAT